MVYQKSFGYHTYKKKIAVKNHHVYDLASLTKITATLPLIIEAIGDEDFKLDSNLSDLIPELKNTNKADLTVKAVLSHHAGLTPWIPFFEKTLDRKKKPKRKYYRNKKKDHIILK